jgi:hypothetical protein
VTNPTTAALLGEAKELAHSLGLDQSSFSRMLSLHAAAELHEAQKFKEGLSREVALLGVNAPLRIR